MLIALFSIFLFRIFLWILLSAILSQPSLFAICLNDVIGYKISEVNWFRRVEFSYFAGLLAVFFRYRNAIFSVINFKKLTLTGVFLFGYSAYQARFFRGLGLDFCRRDCLGLNENNIAKKDTVKSVC